MDTQAMQQQQHVQFVCEAGQLLKKMSQNNLSVFGSRCSNACVCSETLSETTEKSLNSLVLMSEACHDAIQAGYDMFAFVVSYK